MRSPYAPLPRCASCVGSWVCSSSCLSQHSPDCSTGIDSRVCRRTEGTLRVTGIGAAVDIARDASGIPTLTARSEADVLFALGFAHAQDRLWQMSFNRRLAQGRLAEILGPDAVATDRFLRVLGVYRHAQRLAAALDADTRAALGAYARGVNAAIAVRGPLRPSSC